MSLFDYIDKAGVIGYLLVILFTIGMTLIVWKFFHLVYVRVTKSKYIYETLQEIKDVDDVSVAIKIAEKSLDEKMVQLESGMSSIKIIASISPLLGLLGTVIGILTSFEAIASTGLGDPSKFANGISLALITTVIGLIVAIPHYIAFNTFDRTIYLMESKLAKELDLILVSDK